MKIALFVSLATLALITACANTGPSNARGYEVQVSYAEVVEVRREPLPSAAPVGAIVGGFTGLLLSRNKTVGSQVASGVGGAALGGLATKALEGERYGYNYQLRYNDGSITRFITEKGYLRKGDCVSVERGNHSNIRRVPSTLCEGGEGVKTAKANPNHVRDAQQCNLAKEQLLNATTDEEITASARKVEIICEY